MRTLPYLLSVPTGLFVLALSGCSGGGNDPAGQVQVRCANGDAFCLISCDLGCTQAGCAVTEIAENQRLRFTFSQVIDPTSINQSAFAIRTLAGSAPDGDYQVAGNTVTFVPRIRVTNGISTFGFLRNESYVLTLAGGTTASQGIRSRSGDRLAREFSCTVVASRGIIDEDARQPSGELVAPTDLGAAPLDATIVVRFSELIDASPFVGGVNAGTPIQYQLRRSREIGGVRECDRTSAAVLLEGVPRVTVEQVNNKSVTVVSLKPNVNLPGLACVEVHITSDVRDLAGNPATPSSYQFFTRPRDGGPFEFLEPFANPGRMDTLISSGTWNGGARPGQIGGDGRHGSFNPANGNAVGPNVYEWNTDSQLIPASQTLDNVDATVTDGKFYFTDFVLPPGTTVRFFGNNPAQIFVRGKIEVGGTLEANGDPMATFTCRSTTPTVLIPGQPGGRAGAGGGRGGTGGDRCTGNGPTTSGGVFLNNGQPGQDVRLLNGHAYQARAANTGGRGSGLHPAAGTNASLAGSFTINFAFCGLIAPGGNGGGFNTPGAIGAASAPAGITILPGPAASIGAGFDLFPYPPAVAPPNYTALNHFLVGGSGGGGGGSHPFLSTTGSTTDIWRAGAGGSGSGGAIALRAGADLNVAAGSNLRARGGEGAIFSDRLIQGIPAVGGGGSGGSYVLQAGGALTVSGLIDTSGGGGSRSANIQPATMNAETRGGLGSAGFYRLESQTGVVVNSVGHVPAFDAPRMAATLTDADDLVGCASLWRATGIIFPPTWMRYELTVDVHGDGSDIRVYSDDPSVPGSVGPAIDPLGPVRIQFQGAQVSTTTNLPLPGTVGRWRSYLNPNQTAGISINSDNATGFRFMLTFNRKDFPHCVVTNLRVLAQG
ncbi:MAG: hypothetical protein IPK26_05070 [Planctomycetes bacterium]|nr:hypothetical protein [Planctomycetota bacterium]